MLPSIREGTRTYNKLFFYCFITLLEEIIFALVLRTDKFKTEFLRDNLSVLMGLYLEHMFMLDGLINKNIYQVQNYSWLSIYTLILACMTIPKRKNLSLYLNIIFVLIILFDILISIIWQKSLKAEYKWFYYKKYGLTSNLQNAYKLKQKILVYFKIDLICTIVTIVYPYRQISFGNVIKTYNYVVTVLSVLGFLLSYKSENQSLRFFSLTMYLAKVFGFLTEIIAFSFNANFFTVAATLSAVYNIIVDLILVYFLNKDRETFGCNLEEALNENANRKRFLLES
ncbi:hypothetical protein COBT_001177 [Conglomerata obtusa]